MNTDTRPHDYRSILQDSFSRRRSQNPNYSLRAFARDLGLAPSRLSHILSGRYGLSGEAARDISRRLGLSQEESRYFCSLVESRHARSKSRRVQAGETLKTLDFRYQRIDLDSYRTISDWYHFAILELTLLEDFQSTPRWIARRLGIHLTEAQGAIARLERLGMLRRNGNRLEQTGKFFANPQGAPSPLIRKFHQQTLSLASKAIELHSPEERDITNLIVAASEEDLDWVRDKLRELRTELDLRLSQVPRKTHVFSLNLQFFRLTEKTPTRKD